MHQRTVVDHLNAHLNAHVLDRLVLHLVVRAVLHERGVGLDAAPDAGPNGR
jgi:hypothetical protein